MSTDHNAGPESAERELRMRKKGAFNRIVLVVLALLLAFVGIGSTVQVVRDPPQKNELGLRGQFEAEVDPDVEVYFGSDFIGYGPVQVTWDRLLGTGSEDPLAIPINSSSPSPSHEGMGGISAEALAGRDAEILWTRPGMSGHGQFLGGPFSFAWKNVLLRRAGGDLDLVSVLDGEFP